jgi:sugar phosphate isomerase/epimerase
MKEVSMVSLSRRRFNAGLSLAAGAITAPGLAFGMPKGNDSVRELAVQSWTFHKQLFSGEIKATQLPAMVKALGIDMVEWTAKTFRPLANGRETMFQAPSAAFFRDLRQASDDAGVQTKVVNVGGHYFLAGADPATRAKAVDFCMSYVDAALALGAPILRSELYCDLPETPSRSERALDAARTGWNALIEKTAGTNLIINVENHHGISSEPTWLADLVRSMKSERAGLTVDVNNFRTDIDMPYAREHSALPRYVDRYQGLQVLMPFANWVSAKAYSFDSTGYEVSLDYPRIMQIIRDSGYNGALSIEYEGDEDPLEGVRKSIEMFRSLATHKLG